MVCGCTHGMSERRVVICNMTEVANGRERTGLEAHTATMRLRSTDGRTREVNRIAARVWREYRRTNVSRVGLF